MLATIASENDGYNKQPKKVCGNNIPTHCMSDIDGYLSRNKT